MQRSDSMIGASIAVGSDSGRIVRDVDMPVSTDAQKAEGCTPSHGCECLGRLNGVFKLKAAMYRAILSQIEAIYERASAVN